MTLHHDPATGKTAKAQTAASGLPRPECRCPEPAGDPREGRCMVCGRHVAGYPDPGRNLWFR